MKPLPGILPPNFKPSGIFTRPKITEEQKKRWKELENKMNECLIINPIIKMIRNKQNDQNN